MKVCVACKQEIPAGTPYLHLKFLTRNSECDMHLECLRGEVQQMKEHKPEPASEN